MIKFETQHKPILDPHFIPPALWIDAYLKLADANPKSIPIAIGVERSDGTITTIRTKILPHEGAFASLNEKHVERLVKFLLWAKGGWKVMIGGSPAVADLIRSIYSSSGRQAFDYEFMGERIYGKPFTVESLPLDQMPSSKDHSVPLGRNLDGCRIGFDLGGSDRKCAALIDGKVIFSEEVTWDPYFQKDPEYHYQGIRDTIKRAADKLPRVDAIGGSSAGCYVNNEVRVASLFRGLSKEDFEKRIRRIFFELKKDFGNVPFEVVNDGEVTALAGSMSMNDNAVLGISMGTSMAAGYVTPEGLITPWLNELGFVPVDYAESAFRDEWSGDIGCGVQYFSQQAVARLAPKAGVTLPDAMPFPERLVEVQKLMKAGDERARKIYETIGVYFGYSIRHFSDFYDIRNLLILGRVTSGEGGEIIIHKAEEILRSEFPALAGKIKLRTPNEQDKRHGQAIAAASLPKIEKK